MPSRTKALEAVCAEVSVQPRQKVRETRSALVEHFAGKHFVAQSGRFAPPADELLEWIRAGAALEKIGAGGHEDDGGQTDGPADGQEQIDDGVLDDLQDIAADDEHDQQFDQRAEAGSPSSGRRS